MIDETSLLSWHDDRFLDDGPRAALTGPGAPFEMVDGEVLGTRMRIFAQRPANFRQVLEAAGRRFGDQPFLVFPDRTFTHRSLAEPAAAVAASLRSRFGIGPGDRVAVAGANSAAHALAVWATIVAGATVVELNGWWAGPEMLHGIDVTRPKVVLGDRKRLDRLAGEDITVPLLSFEQDLPRLEREGAGSSLPEDLIAEDDALCILFTSGTTGRPRGAVLSHRAHAHMMMQAALRAQVTALLEPASTPPPAAPGAGCTIAVSPMFHISGFSVALVGGALTGSTLVYPPPGRWDPELHLEMTERHRATAWSIVPTHLWRLLEHPSFGRYDLSSLRRIGGGGAMFQPELWRAVGRLLPDVRMSIGFGMTETCGAGTQHDGRRAVENPDAVGSAVPGYEVSVRDPGGRPLGAGESGEIWLRGPCNLLSYWDDPQATDMALTEDRWYRTGDVGHVEDGLLHLDGRRADVIIRGGENVYPVEIENRLIEHPAVAEAAVVGVPDRVLGESVKAVVVTEPGAGLSLDEMRAWVGRTLAPFKVPAELEIVETLPHNAVGKVLKQVLRGAASDLEAEE